MKAIKTQLKLVAICLSTVIILQGCTVYQSATVSLKEASKSNTKVKVVTLDKKTMKFTRISLEDNIFYGTKLNGDEISKTPINETDLKKVHLKDKSKSTLLSIGGGVIIIVGILGLIVHDSLNNMSSGITF